VKSFSHTRFSLQHAHVLCKIPHVALGSLVEVGFPSCGHRIVNAQLKANATVRARSATISACSLSYPGPVPILLKKVHVAGPLVLLCVASEKGYASCMSSFDYTASAELFAAEGRSGLRYRRFAHAAEAIGYAIEKLSDKVLAGLSLHVNDEHYNAMQIRALYESERYPLSRKRT